MLKGKIISTKMKNTAVVLVAREKVHPIYKKRIRVKKKYHVHAEQKVKVGDIVEIIATRPLSKTKRFKVLRVVKK